MSRFRIHHAATGYCLMTDDLPLSALQVDFDSPTMRRRLRRVRTERIVKAVGAAPGRLIVDCTGGLGTDSYLAAMAGAQVEVIERSQVLYLMLQSALQALANDVSDRINLHRGDAVSYLSGMAAVPDGILIDPMYPSRRSSKASAKAKGSMQMLQAFLGTDEDDDQLGVLFRAALATGCRRIVVKRPRWAAPFTNRKPMFVNDGSVSRLEVYSAP